MVSIVNFVINPIFLIPMGSPSGDFLTTDGRIWPDGLPKPLKPWNW